MVAKLKKSKKVSEMVALEYWFECMVDMFSELLSDGGSKEDELIKEGMREAFEESP